jgi:hypothetical protein
MFPEVQRATRPFGTRPGTHTSAASVECCSPRFNVDVNNGAKHVVLPWRVDDLHLQTVKTLSKCVSQVTPTIAEILHFEVVERPP